MTSPRRVLYGNSLFHWLINLEFDLGDNGNFSDLEFREDAKIAEYVNRFDLWAENPEISEFIRAEKKKIFHSDLSTFLVVYGIFLYSNTIFRNRFPYDKTALFLIVNIRR